MSDPLTDLEDVCDEIFERWDKDMRSGKLLTALAGRIENYDQRVIRIRQALTAMQRAAAKPEAEQPLSRK